MQSLTRFPRILDQIFDDVAAMERFGENQHLGLRTMLVLARTARIFQDPALNIIWRTLPSIAPLLYTLPFDLWAIRECPPEHWIPRRLELYFTRPLRADLDLARFRHYSWRVRYIVLPGDDECSHIAPRIRDLSIVPDVYRLLASTHDLRPCLSNLEGLRIRAHPDAISHLPAVFFGNGLVNVHIDCFELPRSGRMEEDERSYSNMLSELVGTSPGLRDFGLGLFTRRAFIFRAISSTLCGFRHLVNFSGQGLDLQIEAFEHLGGIPTLRQLCAVIAFTQDALTPLLKGSATARFPVLQKLHLSGRTVSIYTAILPLIRSRDMSSVELYSGESNASNRAFQDLFTAIANHPSNARIQQLTMDFGMGARRGELDEPTFEPLLALPNLTSLSVDVHSRAMFCDYFLYRMARAWPRLRSIGICTRFAYEVDTPPRATLDGLGMFAAFCPDLTWLGVEVDACKPARAASHRGLVSQETLQTLRVGYSKIEDEASVAAYLSHVFPELDQIAAAWVYDDYEEGLDEVALSARRYGRGWDAVEMLVPQMAKVREQERNWLPGREWHEEVEDNGEDVADDETQFLARLKRRCEANCRNTSACVVVGP